MGLQILITNNQTGVDLSEIIESIKSNRDDLISVAESIDRKTKAAIRKAKLFLAKFTNGNKELLADADEIIQELNEAAEGFPDIQKSIPVGLRIFMEHRYSVIVISGDAFLTLINKKEG